MKKYVCPMKPDCCYHVFNRGIDGCKIFFTDKNYFYFLKLFREKISPIAELYCYCLLPNHFHFLIKLKSENEIRTIFVEKHTIEIETIISKQFSNFFNSYTQAINKHYSRTGKLFELPFRRKLIESDQQKINTIIYIHNNPKKHHLHDDIFEYPYSSIQNIVSGIDGMISSKVVIDLFENIDNFMQNHTKRC